MNKYKTPHPVSDIAVAFPAKVVGTLLPLRSEIPDEFRSLQSPWCQIVSRMFFMGGKFPKTKHGIDEQMARRHITAVLRSFEPKHEHKEGGAAYLMSLWFELPETNKGT